MKAAIIAVLLLSGCTAPVATGIAPVAVTGPSAGGATTDFAAARSGLRRIGYRNCDGYAIGLFAPARVAPGTGQMMYLVARVYRAGGAIRLSLPGAARRIERAGAAGWAALPASVATGAAVSVGPAGGVAAIPLDRAIGAGAPGRYRVWLDAFTASRPGGASCAMTPVWQFEIR